MYLVKLNFAFAVSLNPNSEQLDWRWEETIIIIVKIMTLRGHKLGIYPFNKLSTHQAQILLLASWLPRLLENSLTAFVNDGGCKIHKYHGIQMKLRILFQVVSLKSEITGPRIHTRLLEYALFTFVNDGGSEIHKFLPPSYLEHNWKKEYYYCKQ